MAVLEESTTMPPESERKQQQQHQKSRGSTAPQDNEGRMMGGLPLLHAADAVATPIIKNTSNDISARKNSTTPATAAMTPDADGDTSCLHSNGDGHHHGVPKQLCIPSDAIHHLDTSYSSTADVTSSRSPSLSSRDDRDCSPPAQHHQQPTGGVGVERDLFAASAAVAAAAVSEQQDDDPWRQLQQSPSPPSPERRMRNRSRRKSNNTTTTGSGMIRRASSSSSGWQRHTSATTQYSGTAPIIEDTTTEFYNNAAVAGSEEDEHCYDNYDASKYSNRGGINSHINNNNNIESHHPTTFSPVVATSTAHSSFLPRRRSSLKGQGPPSPTFLGGVGSKQHTAHTRYVIWFLCFVGLTSFSMILLVSQSMPRMEQSNNNPVSVLFPGNRRHRRHHGHSNGVAIPTTRLRKQQQHQHHEVHKAVNLNHLAQNHHERTEEKLKKPASTEKKEDLKKKEDRKEKEDPKKAGSHKKEEDKGRHHAPAPAHDHDHHHPRDEHAVPSNDPQHRRHDEHAAVPGNEHRQHHHHDDGKDGQGGPRKEVQHAKEKHSKDKGSQDHHDSRDKELQVHEIRHHHDQHGPPRAFVLAKPARIGLTEIPPVFLPSRDTELFPGLDNEWGRDHFLYRSPQDMSKHRRIVTLDGSSVESYGPIRKVVETFPADFTDNTQLYPIMDSSDEVIASTMETRVPYIDGECVPMQDWQTTFHPLCNGMHELDMQGLGDDRNEDDINLFGMHGFWRNAWKLVSIGGHNGWKDRENVVLKTIKISHRFEDAYFENHRIDAVVLERLTPSPHVIDVFGFCGHSVLTEYADGKRVGELADKKAKEPLARLKIARDIASGLADVHGIDGDDNATFVHLDINPANVVSIGGTLKLNDFNIGVLRRWNTTSNKPCGIPAQYPNPQWRSPEEARKEQNLTEKVDVFSMGHILFRMICGHEPWHKFEPGGNVPPKDVLNKKVSQGVLPTIPDEILNSSNPEVIAIRDAMLRCYTHNPDQRPSARDIANSLQDALTRLESSGSPDVMRETH